MTVGSPNLRESAPDLGFASIEPRAVDLFIGVDLDGCESGML